MQHQHRSGPIANPLTCRSFFLATLAALLLVANAGAETFDLTSATIADIN